MLIHFGRSHARLFRYSLIAISVLVILSELVATALARTTGNNKQTAESWAWNQIKQGRAADFNVRCGTPALDPSAADDKPWANSCRIISGAFLVGMLTDVTKRNLISNIGIRIVGARIDGDINFQNVKIEREILIEQSRIEHEINFDSARTNSRLGIVGSRVAGSVTANEFHGDLSLFLRETEFKKTVSLVDAKLRGNVDMAGATFDDELIAHGLEVGSSLWMGSTGKKPAIYNGVGLATANIAGILNAWRYFQRRSRRVWNKGWVESVDGIDCTKQDFFQRGESAQCENYGRCRHEWNYS